MKKVSVITPVYKVEKYVADTIQSVLNQTYENFELILIDDGSPDRSVEICQQFQDPRIRIIRQENRGACAARNHGIRVSEGDYLAFLDADDLWLPQKLEKHVEHLNNNPRVGISYSCSAFIDEEGKPNGLYQIPRLTGITKPHLICRNPIGNGSAPVIRRETFEAVKFQDNLYGEVEDFYWDERLKGAQDVDCWMRIGLLTDWQIEGIPDILTLYRVNSGGISANLSKHAESWFQMMEKARAYDLIDRWGNTAKAYYLRYLARRAVTLQSGSSAMEMFHRALALDWRILLYEPRRTVLTGAAVYLLNLLPRSLYNQLQTTAMKSTGARQKRKVSGVEG
jgi:glycosyltransferase involved in cell wall biosynthesis